MYGVANDSASETVIGTTGSIVFNTGSVYQKASTPIFSNVDGTITLEYYDSTGGFEGTLDGTATLTNGLVLGSGEAVDVFTIEEGSTVTVADSQTVGVGANGVLIVNGTLIPATTDSSTLTNGGYIEIGDKGAIGSSSYKFSSSSVKGVIANGVTGENLFVNTTTQAATADASVTVAADTNLTVVEAGVTITSATINAGYTLEIEPTGLLTVSDEITLSGAGAILYVNGDGGVTATVDIGTGSIVMTNAAGTFGIAYGSTQLYGTLTSGTVEVVSADDAYLVADLIIESGATLQIDSGVTLELRDYTLYNEGTITGSGTITVSDSTYQDGALIDTGSIASTITLEYYSSGGTITVTTAAAFVSAVTSGEYSTVILGADIELDDSVLDDDLTISAMTIRLGYYKLTLNADVEFVFKNAKLYTSHNFSSDSHGYIIVTEGVLVNNNSDIYSTVEIGANGSVDNTKAKKQSSAGSSFSEDMKVGYGNVLTLSNYTVASNTTAEIYGTIIFDGSTKIADSGRVIVYGEAQIKGSMTVAGSMAVFGKATLSSTMSLTGITTGHGAELYVEPREADLATLRTLGYEDEDWGFYIDTDGTLTVTKMNSTSSYHNMLWIEQPGFNTFRVNGTLNMNDYLATSYSSTGPAHITNGGIVNINGIVDSDIMIGLLDGVTMNITSVTGTVNVNDYDASLYETASMTSGFRLSSTNDKVPNQNTVSVTNMKGVTLTEELTTSFYKNVKNYFNNLSISGTFANLDKNTYYGGASSIVMYGSADISKLNRNYTVSKIHIASDISVGEKVYAYFASGNINVDSGNTLTAIQDGTRVILNGAVLTVSGVMKTEGKDGSDLVLMSGTLNAARYVVIDSDAITTVFYTNIDDAIATIATVEDKTVYAYGEITASSDFTLAKDQIITFVPFGNTTSVKVTVKGTSVIADGAYATGTGYFSVSGMLTFENYYDSYSASGDIVADVIFDNEPIFIYTSLTNAVAIPGVEEIVLNQTATVSKSMTIPEGVKVTSNKYSIIVNKDVVMTVAGQVVLTKGTIFLENPTDEEYTPGDIIVTGSVIVKYQGTESGWTTYGSTSKKNIGLVDIDGAHYTAKYNGISMYFITSVEYAAENVTSGAVTIKGIVVSGDANFAYTKGDELVITVSPYYEYEYKDSTDGYEAKPNNSSLTIALGSALTIDQAEFIMGSENISGTTYYGTVTGTIMAACTDGISSVSFNAAKNISLKAVETETAKGIENYVYIKGIQAGSVSIDAGTVIMGSYGTYTTSEEISEIFYVDSDAVLQINAGTFTAKGDYVTIDGSILIDGTTAVLDQADETELNGTIKITGKGQLQIGGTLQVNDGGSIIVDETQAKEGYLYLTDAASILAVGTKMSSLSAGASVTGPITIADDGAVSYVKVYPGSTVDEIIYGGSSDTIVEAEFYVNAELYMTTYSVSGKVYAYQVVDGEVFSLEGLDCGNVDLKTGLYARTESTKRMDSWFTDMSMTEDKKVYYAGDKMTTIAFTSNVFYGSAAPAKVSGTVTVGVGLTLYIDGKTFDKQYWSDNPYLTVGTHTVSVQVENLYDASKVTLKFNGVTVPVTSTGSTIDVTADMVYFTLAADGAQPYTPEPTPEPTPVEEKEWTVTTILLCVLVVLIAIMAVIVALRLNRN